MCSVHSRWQQISLPLAGCQRWECALAGAVPCRRRHIPAHLVARLLPRVAVCTPPVSIALCCCSSTWPAGYSTGKPEARYKGGFGHLGQIGLLGEQQWQVASWKRTVRSAAAGA